MKRCQVCGTLLSRRNASLNCAECSAWSQRVFYRLGNILDRWTMSHSRTIVQTFGGFYFE